MSQPSCNWILDPDEWDKGGNETGEGTDCSPLNIECACGAHGTTVTRICPETNDFRPLGYRLDQRDAHGTSLP